MSPSPHSANAPVHERRRRAAAVFILAAVGALLVLPGCATRTTQSRSSWDLFRVERYSSWQRLGETASLLEGGNDWEDVAASARLLEQKQGTSGFTVIGRDLRDTFAPPFNFDELRDTFRLLR